MEFTYTITHYDSATDVVTVKYSSPDPELADVATTLHVPNASNDEQLAAIIKEHAPINLWSMTVIEKNLNPVIGQPQTAHRDLLRDAFNPTIEATKL